MGATHAKQDYTKLSNVNKITLANGSGYHGQTAKFQQEGKEVELPHGIGYEHHKGAAPEHTHGKGDGFYEGGWKKGIRHGAAGWLAFTDADGKETIHLDDVTYIDGVLIFASGTETLADSSFTGGAFAEYQDVPVNTADVPGTVVYAANAPVYAGSRRIVKAEDKSHNFVWNGYGVSVLAGKENKACFRNGVLISTHVEPAVGISYNATLKNSAAKLWEPLAAAAEAVKSRAAAGAGASAAAAGSSASAPAASAAPAHAQAAAPSQAQAAAPARAQAAAPAQVQAAAPAQAQAVAPSAAVVAGTPAAQAAAPSAAAATTTVVLQTPAATVTATIPAAQAPAVQAGAAPVAPAAQAPAPSAGGQ